MLIGLRRITAFVLVLSLLLAGFAGVAYAQADPPNYDGSPSGSNLDSPNAIALPDSGSTNTAGHAYAITNLGTGRAGFFYLNNSTSANPALEGRSTSSAAGSLGLVGRVMAAAGGSGSAAILGVNHSSNANGYGVMGQHNGTGIGVYGYVIRPNATGVYGNNTATTGSGKGVYGQTASPGGYGGFFANTATSGTGVYGSGASYGVYGTSANFGVTGYSPGGSASAGVFGFSPNGNGVRGESARIAVLGHANGDSSYGVWGDSSGANSTGVAGFSTGVGSTGVRGENNGAGIGVSGSTSAGGIGVRGTAVSTGLGVVGIGGATGVYGNGDDWAGYFEGVIYAFNVESGAAGTTMRIDHPLDPANKYLYSSAVQSQEMLGVHNGNSTLDAKGEAVVTLPDWFEAAYKDFRYQLTAIGASAPELYVAAKIKGNQFKIAGGKPGLEVSWLVTGVRDDEYARKHPQKAEQLKSEAPATPDLNLPAKP